MLSCLFSKNWLSIHVGGAHLGIQHRWICTKGPASSNSSGDSTVSYLVHSCGLSQEAAIVAARKVNLHSLPKAETVLSLLREYKFSDTQISALVRKHPKLVIADAQNTLLPKFEFLTSIGISRLDLATVLTYNPRLLDRSLQDNIIPCYTFLKDLVLSDSKVVTIWKNNSWVFLENLSKHVIPNVAFVRELSMPQSCLAYLVTYKGRILLKDPELFSQLVVEVQQLGFDPQMANFVHAMAALYAKETWKRCQEAYRSWGWSDDDIRSAFRSCPMCMTKSEKKIMATMEFLVNKMGLQSGDIAKYPYIFGYSLEKRIIPRGSVVKVLLLKGFIEEKELSLATLCSISEERFLYRFVTRYLDHVPQLSDVYQGKVDICE
ncbi:transcription termination factor MTERF5, chloroplastic-like [Argentina anserina]|uniref:transcription termination factor MTERF5, chloroplastic-like n=1 Tax=Argentina anserina TaxID=57926 RepID=UPI0021768437|nr:transcription termination factor MTERF5, chloroplastic-like [Potentilla anserina]